MRVSAEKVLLALLGYLHFRCADGMVPAGQINPNNFPERTAVIRMNDGCIFQSPIADTANTARWLWPFQGHPIEFRFFIRFRNKLHDGVFEEPGFNLRGLGPHNHVQHTPDSVQIRIRGDTYYLASPFQVRPQSWNIRSNYIYVAVPQGHTYQALLRSQKFEKDSKRYCSIYPGAPPSPKRKNASDRPFYVRMMHCFLRGN